MNEIKEWYPLYARDWLTSFDLSFCSLEAKGLLIDLMCMSWENGNPGIITRPAKDIARFLRVSETKLEELLEELVSRKRVEIDGDLFGKGSIRIQKMIQVGKEQKEKHQRQVESGKRGAKKRWENNSPSEEPLAPENGNPMATPWQPYSNPIAIDKSREDKNKIDKNKIEEGEDAHACPPPSGSFKYYGKELLNKINFSRELTTSEKIRWVKTIGRILQDSMGTENPKETVINIIDRAMKHPKAKHWRANPEFFLRDYGEFLEEEMCDRGVIEPVKQAAPKVFIQIELMGNEYSQGFKSQEECDAFIKKEGLGVIRTVGTTQIYGKEELPC